MTLKEAIKHCEDVADYDCFTDDQRKCSDEHRQLADWLRELKERREKEVTGDLISRQTALSAIEANQGTLNKRRVMKILEGLPSAEKAQLSEEDATFDCISRQDAIDLTYAETVSTNPEHFKSSEKFIEFMDDIDISDFGRWQWANGFNTALVAIKIQLKNLPSASTEFSNNSPKLDNENGDLISRQDALRDIRSMDVCVMYDDMCSTEEAVEKAIVATKRTAIFGLERMPSASPDLSTFSDKLWKIAYERGKAEGRKKGKWIDEKKDSISLLVWGECSICGYDSDIHYCFCPNCGADMREGDSE